MSHPFMAKALTHFLHILLLLVLLISQKPHFTSSNPTGFSAKLIPRDSPESPLYPGNLTQTQRLERLVRFSKERAQYLRYSTSKSPNPSNATSRPQEARMALLRNNFYYIVKTAIGNPATVLYVIMDTGGGLVWTQCLPCTNCYKQTIPLYDSAASSSYWKLPCSHFLCNGGPQSRYQCVNNECVYSVNYGGGTGPTKGVASVETIWFLLSSGGGIQAIDGIVFGCSNDNTNFYNFENTAISGVMGLSWSPDSLMTQLSAFINNRFSYCIAPFYQDWPERGSMLTFGDAIPTPRGILLSTNFVKPPSEVSKYYFYLNLLDISVGWVRLGFPPDTFKINQDGSGGLVIDSGAPASSLINQNLPNGRNPYKEVIGNFQRYYDSLKLMRRNDVRLLELCYQQPPDFKDFLTLTYHFEGADYIVDGRNVNYYNKEEGYFCVALVGNGGISMLGAWHQQNTRIIYNGVTNSLQFASEDCTQTG